MFEEWKIIMDIEKMVNSKWYIFFDWVYKLIVMNLLTILISVVSGIGFYLLFYYIQHGIFFLLGICVSFFTFIFCFVTNYRIIKLNDESKLSNIFKNYFIFFWENIKSIWLIALSFTIIFSILLFSGYIYWLIVNTEGFVFDAIGWLYVIGFWAVLMIILSLFLGLFNLPAVVSYFRMKTWNYIKASFFIAFKYFFKSLFYLVLAAILPLLIIITINPALVSIWSIIGISGVQYIMYITSKGKFWYLTHNVEDFKTEDKIEMEEEND